VSTAAPRHLCGSGSRAAALLLRAVGRLHELVEAITESPSEVADVESSFDPLSRPLAIQMERDFGFSWMLPRDDVVLSGLYRLSASRTDERRSLVLHALILTDG